jgi:hypothetical protein
MYKNVFNLSYHTFEEKLQNEDSGNININFFIKKKYIMPKYTVS